MSMPRHQPTDEKRRIVETLAGYGIPQRDIAKVIQTGTTQLHRDYAEELETGAAKANAKIAENLFRIATNPNVSGPTVAAAIFWAKTRMGWRETPQQVDHTVRLQRIERVYIDPTDTTEPDEDEPPRLQ
jgi:hypothetical protein